MTPLLAQRPRVDRGFERLYRRHVADVYHYALGVLRNPADAEDVTQTTFLNALRAYDRGERPQAPQNWLIAIAHNVCRQRFRQSLRRPHEVAFEDDVADRIVDDEVPSAEDIRRALGYLAFNQRAALVMRELEGRTYAEIAEILGLSIGAVATLRQNRLVRVRAEQARTREAAVSHGRHAAAKASVRAHAAPRAHPAHPAHPGRPIHPVRPRHPTHPIQAVPTHPAHPVHPAHPTHAAHQAHPKHARGHKPPKE